MDVLETVLLKILDMSITASYVIMAVLLVRLLLKHAPKVFSYALWSVAAFRLVCPVSFSSVMSIFNIGTLPTPQSIEDAAIQPTVSTGNMATMPQTSVPPALTNGHETIAAEAQSADPMQTVLTVAAVLWCLGVAVMLTYSIISYLKIRNSVKQGVRFEDNVYECDGIQSPFVLGIIKPKIYIPFRMNEKERSCILCHERHHIRRFDHVIKPFAFVILTVYWFHPLVWLAYIFMCKDMEMSCDEKVISLLGTAAKQEYSLSLLSVGTNRRLPVAGPLFFGESDVKSRVKNVLCFKKPKVWAVMLAVTVCVAAAVACTANAQTDKAEEVSPMETPAITRTSPPVVGEPDAYDISGRYEFEENVYTNPLSSFFAVKGHMPYFDITDNALRIVDEEFDTVEKYAGTFAPADINEDDFEALFQNDIVVEGMMPDISVYKKCTQYAVFTDEYNRLEYSLYLMDDEVWLVSLNTDRVWSIYRLVKSGDISESTVGGADGPENVVTDGITLEICNGKDVRESVLLTDSEAQSAIQDIIAQYENVKERTTSVNIFQAGEYIRLINTDGRIYYVFHNAEEPQMQKMLDSHSLAALPQEHYEALFTLWESHINLPAMANVNFGDEKVSPLVYRASSAPAPQDIKDQIPYITVDGQDGSLLQVFIDGNIVHGRCEVFNADTLEQLELFEPSGLYQETIVAAMLKAAEPGQSFIIMMSVGYAKGNQIYGYTIVFGAKKIN